MSGQSVPGPRLSRGAKVEDENMRRIFTILFVAFVMAQLFSNKFVLHVRNRARQGEEVFWTDYTRDLEREASTGKSRAG